MSLERVSSCNLQVISFITAVLFICSHIGRIKLAQSYHTNGEGGSRSFVHADEKMGLQKECQP